MAIGQLQRTDHNGTYGGYNDTLPANEATATPLARRIARFNGIALSSLAGSGGNGRIVLRDVVPATIEARPVAPPEPASPPSAEISPPPHFHLTARCRMDRLLAVRSEINDALRGRGIAVSITAMLVRAMVVAMAAVPEVNVRLVGNAPQRLRQVDIALAVPVAGGLTMPVLRGVESLSVAAIAEAVRAAADRARQARDDDGAAAAIANLGGAGIDAIVPTVAPPRTLVLGIGTGTEQPWKVDDALGLATVFSATASIDRRAIDAATGTRFLAAFRSAVEDPLGMLA